MACGNPGHILPRHADRVKRSCWYDNLTNKPLPVWFLHLIKAIYRLFTPGCIIFKTFNLPYDHTFFLYSEDSTLE